MNVEPARRKEAHPRRICFVLESAYTAFDSGPTIGGAEVQVRILAERLATAGFEVYIATAERIDHDRIISLGTGRLLRTLRRLRPAVVVATVATKAMVRAAVACRLLGLAFVYRVANTGESLRGPGHDVGGNPLNRLVFRSTLRYLTPRIWCQHDAQRQNLESQGLGGKSFVAVNLSPDRRRETPAAEKNTVLWVGRYTAAKRPHLFPRIAARLPHRRCLMICPGSPQSFRSAHADLPNLRVLGYVPPEEMAAHFAEARVLVNTSSTEGFPNTFIEAACQGTPIITTVKDPGGYLGRYGHGAVVGDCAEAAATVDNLFDDVATHERWSSNARRYFEETHELERNFPRLVSLLFSDTSR